MKKEIKYTCVKCDAPVDMVGTQAIRTCDHHDVGIAAKLSATAYGESKVK